MAKAQIIRKLQAYKKNPELIKEVSNTELADLVLIVMRAVEAIDEAIKEGRLDGYTPQPDKDYVSKNTAVQYLTTEVNKVVSKIKTKEEELEGRIQEAINNIRDGKDGIITDAEIERAATIAASLIKLPDFDGIMTAAIQGNGALIRDALESLPEGEEQLTQEAIQGLVPKLKELSERIDNMVLRSGGTIGRNQVYNFIAQAVADGTIPSGSGSSTFLDLTDTPSSYSGQGGKLVAVKGAEDGVEFIAPPSGSGDVIGPASSTDNNIALFNGVTGKIIKDSGVTTAAFAAASHTHTASDITDFDTEVSNNTDVAANTAARHAAVTLSGTPDYITIVGQTITRSLINLASHVTGRLPFANLAQLSAHQVLGRAGTGTGDAAGITMGNDTILGRAGSGNVGALSATQVRTLINVEDGATADQVASEVPFTPAGSIAATNVQAAIQELDTEKALVSHTHAISDVTGLQTALDAKPTLSNGSGAPSSTPSKIGDFYIDTTNDILYYSVGSASSADWIEAGTGAGGSFTWEGDWVTATAYQANDVVRSSGGGYVCILDHTSGASTEPGVGASWTTYWDLFVQDGAAGVTSVAMTVPTGLTVSGSPITSSGTLAVALDTGYVIPTQAALDAKAPLASPTFTGTADFVRIDYDGAIGTVSALGNLGATETFDWSTAANFTGTLDANITINFSNAVSGQRVTLYLAYDGTAQRTIAFTPTIKWLGGTAPTGPDATGEVLVLTITYIGTTYYGSAEIAS